MNASTQKQYHDRRRCHYVDDRIQGGLVAALIVFEFVVFSIAMVILYYDLNLAIEEQMYKIHPGPQDGTPALMTEILVILPYIILINIVLVVVIDWVWSRYVGRIIGALKGMFQAVLGYDLRHGPMCNINHEVLITADNWVREERQRNRKLQEAVTVLNAEGDQGEMVAAVKRMRNLLPESDDGEPVDG